MLRNLNIIQYLDIAPMERVWFYETLSFEVVIVMVKDEKI